MMHRLPSMTAWTFRGRGRFYLVQVISKLDLLRSSLYDDCTLRASHVLELQQDVLAELLIDLVGRPARALCSSFLGPVLLGPSADLCLHR